MEQLRDALTKAYAKLEAGLPILDIDGTLGCHNEFATIFERISASLEDSGISVRSFGPRGVVESPISSDQGEDTEDLLSAPVQSLSDSIDEHAEEHAAASAKRGKKRARLSCGDSDREDSVPIQANVPSSSARAAPSRSTRAQMAKKRRQTDDL